MAVTKYQARRVAEQALRELEAKSGKRMAIFDGEFGVPGIVDHDDVWIVNWNTADYLQSGNVFDQFLAGPIAVPKNGDEFFILGTAGTTDEELDRWRAQRSRPTAKFYFSYYVRPDGTRLDTGLFRREREDDMTGDAVFESDGRWHFTITIERSLKGFSDTGLREVSEAEARQLLEEKFGAPSSEFYAPMVVDGGHRPPPT